MRAWKFIFQVAFCWTWFRPYALIFEPDSFIRCRVCGCMWAYEIWPVCVSEGLPKPGVFLVWMTVWETDVRGRGTVVIASSDHQRFLDLSSSPSVMWYSHASLSFLELSGTETYLLHKCRSQPEESCKSNHGILYIHYFSASALCIEWIRVSPSA